MNRNVVMMALVMVMAVGCRTHYEVTRVERERILIDSRYDGRQDTVAAALLQSYQQQVDSIMSPVVGRSAKDMSPHRPESELSNLLADIMVWGGKFYQEKPDLGVYNMGGVRADLPKDDVTYGDVLDIAPFENKIAFVTMTGDALLELFRQHAMTGGEGVSLGVELVITSDGRLVSAKLNGEPISPQRKYRIATIDYLLAGNDGMTAFLKGTDVNSPQDYENNSRFIIMNYFREQTKLGKEIDAVIEGRVKVENYE